MEHTDNLMHIINALRFRHCINRVLHCTFNHTDPQFTEMQYQFMEDHYHHFEDKDENKFVYTEIFAKYVRVVVVSSHHYFSSLVIAIIPSQTKLIEKYIDKELSMRIEGFEMSSFIHTLE